MANNTRQARREAEFKRKLYFQDYLDMFVMLFHNSVNVKGVDESDLPKRYLLKMLLEKGGIAYSKKTGLYLPYNSIGINVYGLPTSYELVGANGYILRCKPEECVILRANDNKVGIINYIENQINKIVDYDMAIEQNLEAIKTMTLVECEDQATLLSLVNLTEARRIGASVAFINRNANIDSSVKVQSTGAVYLVDKLLEARQKLLNEALNRVGVSSANTEKRERVQGFEVQAADAFTKDCINILVDTFNHDAEVGGLSIRLEINTTDIVESEDNNQEQNEVGEDNVG